MNRNSQALSWLTYLNTNVTIKYLADLYSSNRALLPERKREKRYDFREPLFEVDQDGLVFGPLRASLCSVVAASTEPPLNFTRNLPIRLGA